MIKIEESLLSNQGVINISFEGKENINCEWAECKIYENDNLIFDVHHDSNTPENNNLWMNFSDCYNVICLLEKFYKYGLENKQISFGMKNI